MNVSTFLALHTDKTAALVPRLAATLVSYSSTGFKEIKVIFDATLPENSRNREAFALCRSVHKQTIRASIVSIGLGGGLLTGLSREANLGLITAQNQQNQRG